jgi:methionyl-tRNA formyltransferase
VRTVLLTTDTPHHLYWAWCLQEAVGLTGIVVETGLPTFPFETAHPFERERDNYETAELLSGAPTSLSAVAPVIQTPNINLADVIQEIHKLRADVIIVFGTGLLQPTVAAIPAFACLNLHGGNPEAYRGLDSHLWAVYHRDFANLVTTLHFVSPELDTGDVVFSTTLRTTPGMQLHQLRAVNTRACVEMSLLALTALARGLALPRRSQQARGRYYSAMPSVLKHQCVQRFARYAAGL